MSGKEIYIRKDGSYTFTFNQNDEVICGNTAADLEGVIGTNLYWKGLSVNAYLRYGFGGDLFNSTLFERIEKIGEDIILVRFETPIRRPKEKPSLFKRL